MNTYIFDVDNTLTPPRQKLLQEHSIFFTNFIKYNKVYIVSGSDLEKIKWQLSSNILENVSAVFSCLGNCMHIKNKLIYENKFKQLSDTNLQKDIEEFIKNSKTPIRTSNHIEYRIGMINISTIGRAASIQDRQIYSHFDEKEGERQKFADYLRKNYPALDVSIGGEISIDISVNNFNKAQILQHIPEKNNLIFFGDRCNDGGNDQPLAAAVLKTGGTVYNVDCCQQTYDILAKFNRLQFEG